MKLQRIQAIELLGSLRALDGIRSGDKVTAFTFAPAVVDKIVSNILLLRPVQAAVGEYQKEIARMTIPVGSSAEEIMAQWLAAEIDLPLLPLSHDDLNLAVNPISVNARVGLTLIDAPASSA